VPGAENISPEAFKSDKETQWNCCTHHLQISGRSRYQLNETQVLQ